MLVLYVLSLFFLVYIVIEIICLMKTVYYRHCSIGVTNDKTAGILGVLNCLQPCLPLEERYDAFLSHLKTEEDFFNVLMDIKAF